MHEYIKLKSNINSLSLEENDVGIVIKRGEKLTIKSLRLGKFFDIPEDSCDFFNIEETGDIFEYKVCDRCYKCLNTKNHFEDNRSKGGGLITKRPSCRDCRKIKNGISIKSKDRALFNETKPQIGSLFTCPICTKTTIVGITKIVLDHNHGDGTIRGWVCESCNTGIGRFDDNVDLLSNAINWLRRDR